MVQIDDAGSNFMSEGENRRSSTPRYITGGGVRTAGALLPGTLLGGGRTAGALLPGTLLGEEGENRRSSTPPVHYWGGG